jgi:hypothetical protein
MVILVKGSGVVGRVLHVLNVVEGIRPDFDICQTNNMSCLNGYAEVR